MRRRTRADRVFRLLLRLFPSEFRGDFGDDMSAVFRDERAEARTAGRLGIVRLWWRTVGDSLKTAPREHGRCWRETRRMACVSCGSIRSRPPRRY